MLNAEDTKERIRKLRLKVISDPTDINSTRNTQDGQKPTKEWEDKLVLKNDNKEPFSDTDTISCLLYTSPSPRDLSTSRMPSSA